MMIFTRVRRSTASVHHECNLPQTSDLTVNSLKASASGAVHFIGNLDPCLAVYMSSLRSLERPKSPTFTTLLPANKQFRAARSLNKQRYNHVIYREVHLIHLLLYMGQLILQKDTYTKLIYSYTIASYIS